MECTVRSPGLLHLTFSVWKWHSNVSQDHENRLIDGREWRCMLSRVRQSSLHTVQESEDGDAITRSCCRVAFPRQWPPMVAEPFKRCQFKRCQVAWTPGACNDAPCLKMVQLLHGLHKSNRQILSLQKFLTDGAVAMHLIDQHGFQGWTGVKGAKISMANMVMRQPALGIRSPGCWCLQ